MIYVSRDTDGDVYQGDLFADVPFVDFDLSEQVFFPGPESEPATWEEATRKARAENKDILGMLFVRPRLAMVIDQACDIARRDAFVTLCAVDDFAKVHPDLGTKTSPSNLQKHITKLSKVVLRWFYLPADAERMELSKKTAADFRVTTRLAVSDLRTLRCVAGLNDYAREHLRHRVAYFFQRYPVDEWYALDHDEFDAYRKDGHPDAAPFPWQSSELKP